MLDHPAADLAVLVSDRPHGYVVAEGVPGLAPDGFTRVEVEVKTFRGQGWLRLHRPETL